VASLAFHAVLIAVLVVIPYGIYQAYVQPAPPAVVTYTPPHKGVSTPDEVTSDKVESKLTHAIKAAESLSDEEKLNKLEGLSDQLNKVSNEESLKDLAQRFKGWMGTKDRATQPAEGPVAGSFDFDTAQIHNVKRSKDKNGRWAYRTELIDSAGRTMEIDTDPADGESTYRMFQLLKSNPLADKIYREMTMGLIDKMIRSAREAAKQPPAEIQPAPDHAAPAKAP
jgi:hypothetical protein